MLLTQRNGSSLRAVLCDEGKVGEQCRKPRTLRAVLCDEGAKVGEQCSKAPGRAAEANFRLNPNPKPKPNSESS